MPAPMDAPLDTPGSADAAAAAAMKFATSAEADSLALSGAVLSPGSGGSIDATSAAQQDSESVAAQLEAWREVWLPRRFR